MENIYELGLLSKIDNPNLDYLIQEVYSIHLNKFTKNIDESIANLIETYIKNLQKYTNELREKSEKDILDILNNISSKNPILADLIIMNFCLPNCPDNINPIFYEEVNKDCIRKYLPKLKNIISEEIMVNFGCEYLTKNNYLPLFCIDLLWKFIISKNNEIEFSFCKSIEHGFLYIETCTNEPDFIEISDKNNLTIKESDNYYIVLSMNYNDVIKMGLGNDNYGANLTLRNIIHFLFTDENMVDRNLEKYRSNYANQRKIYLKNNIN